MKLQKNLVNTPDANGPITPINYMRKADGSIDLAAYKGLEGEITQNNLNIHVKIKDARVRYGHLDLCVTPVSGSGTVWVERKNIVIPDDKSGKKKTGTAARLEKMSKVSLDTDDVFNDENSPISADELRAMIKALVMESNATESRKQN